MAYKVEVKWDSTWVDETTYARDVQTRAGFERPWASVAGVGECKILLDNASQRFSPEYTGGPLYGFLTPGREVRVSVDTEVIWRGYIEDLVPDPGTLTNRCTKLICRDGLAQLAKQQIGVVHEDSKAADDAVAAVVAAAYTPPATSYSDNGDLLQHYGRSWTPENTTCLAALRQIAEAVYGRFYLQRDGTATFRTRNEDQDASETTALDLSGADQGTYMGTRLAGEEIVNQVQVTVYPAETVGALQDIWKAQTTLRITPGEERVISAPFRDDNGERCGAVEVVDPVATTDYTVEDSNGADCTSSSDFSIDVVIEATRAEITLGNTGTKPLYMTLLKVRGKPIRVWDPVVIEKADSASQAAYFNRARVFDLVMQSDTIMAESLAEYILDRHADPALSVSSVVFQDVQVLGSVNLWSLDLFDLVEVSDTQTGMDQVKHWIQWVGYSLYNGQTRIELGLERADQRQYWLLGIEDFSELGETTVLGF